MDVETVMLSTADGLTLEGELAVPDEARALVTLAHPHPLHGGNMRSIVIGALFAALPAAGIACLRFNFRGVGASEGTHDRGDGERHDIVAAVDLLTDIGEGLPLVLAGWSFGADTALAVEDERAAGWLAVAPPLRNAGGHDGYPAARDGRPKLLVVPEHDQFRDPDSARGVVEGWANTSVEVVPGADHFLVGRTDRVVDLALRFLVALSRAQHG